MWEFSQKYLCMEIEHQQHHVLSSPVTILSIRLVLCGSILYGNSYYIVVAGILVPSAALVEIRPKSLHVTGMFLACNMHGFGTFSMYACCVHVTCRDLEYFQCMLHVTCM